MGTGGPAGSARRANDGGEEGESNGSRGSSGGAPQRQLHLAPLRLLRAALRLQNPASSVQIGQRDGAVGTSGEWGRWFCEEWERGRCPYIGAAREGGGVHGDHHRDGATGELEAK